MKERRSVNQKEQIVNKNSPLDAEISGARGKSILALVLAILGTIGIFILPPIAIASILLTAHITGNEAFSSSALGQFIIVFACFIPFVMAVASLIISIDCNKKASSSKVKGSLPTVALVFSIVAIISTVAFAMQFILIPQI